MERAVDHRRPSTGCPLFERLDAGLTDRGGGVAVPRAGAVGVVPGARPPDRVDPALELGVVGLAEALPEAGGDLPAPVPAVRSCAAGPTSRPIMALPFSADHLGAHLVGDAGGDEQLDVDVPARRGPKIAICGSASPPAQRVGRRLDDLDRAISSSNRNRVTSTSWTSESRTIIALSKSAARRGCGARSAAPAGGPSSPRSISAFSAAYSGSKRRMKPTWISRLPSSASRLTTSERRRDVGGQRLLAQHRLAVLQAGQQLLLVGRARGGEHDRVDVRVGDRVERVGDGAAARDRRRRSARPSRSRSR